MRELPFVGALGDIQTSAQSLGLHIHVDASAVKNSM
jgi:hypothetical protein